MLSRLHVLLIVLLLVMLFGLLTSGLPDVGWVSGAAAQVARPSRDGIGVVGAGFVLAEPNVARIRLGVEVSDALLPAAQSEANRRMEAVIQQLKAAGISESDIRTLRVDVETQYDQGGAVLAYRVQNVVGVRSTDVPAVSALIDSAVAAGANRVLAIGFEFDDIAGLKMQARDLALQNARAKAELLAREAGVQVGPLLSIEESDPATAAPARAAASPAASPAAVAAPSQRTPIQPGELELFTNVRVVWGGPLSAASETASSTGRVQEISVLGAGSVFSQPNVARIRLGVDVANAALADAWAEARSRMEAIIQSLKAAGVSDSEIRTVSVDVTPQYDRSGTITGHRVQNVVAVKSTNIAGVSSLIDGALGAGATRVLGISFDVDDHVGPMEQVRALAVQNAQAKAEQIARRAGVDLGRPIAIAETDPDGIRPVRVAPGPLPASASTTGTPIQPGEVEVQTSVRAIWAIE